MSLAGAAWKDDTKCRPREPVSVLQVHGDADAIVHYGGGLLFDLPGHGYPGALQTASTFALKDRCTGALTQTGAPFDFDVSAPGAADTTMSDYAGCPEGDQRVAVDRRRGVALRAADACRVFCALGLDGGASETLSAAPSRWAQKVPSAGHSFFAAPRDTTAPTCPPDM